MQYLRDIANELCGLFATIVEGHEIGMSMVLVAVLLGVGSWISSRRPHFSRIAWNLAAVTLVATGIYLIAKTGARSPSDLLELLVRAVLASGLMLGLSWLALPVAAAIWGTGQRFLFAPCSGFLKSNRQRMLQRRTKRREQQNRQRADALEQELKPEQARLQKEHEERAAEIERTRIASQRERDETRMEVRLLYDRHQCDIAGVFPEGKLNEYFKQFLTDDLPSEQFQQRAGRLCSMIRDSLNRTGAGNGELTSFEDVVSHYADQLERIRALDVEESLRQTLEVLVFKARDRAFEDLLK